MTDARAAGAKALPQPWLAKFIVPAWRDDAPAPERAIRFRRTFTIDGDVTSAELFVTACGVFECEIDGRAVGDHVLSPGWTSYRHRHRLIRHDVGGLLSRGENAIGITVAEGWYRGRLGFGEGKRANYGDEIGPIAQLIVRQGDGTTSVVATDASWRAHASPILSSGLYDGEAIDLLNYDAAWSTAGYDDGAWSPVRESPFADGVLFIPDSPPVRRVEELAPVSIERRASGKTLIDFGQNIAGRLRVRVPAASGTRMTMRHAEVLEDGELALRPLRGAKATDAIIGGETATTWEPSFTFHGFRYAEIEGWPGAISPDDVRAVVCHTDMREIGSFSCSNEMLNRLHSNARWSMKGNFVDVPTDCPQRNERLGWTGDLQVFAPTACFLYDCRSMLESWLDDLSAEQEQYGSVPSWIPFVEMGFPPIPTAAWGDAAVIVPWTLYRHFGDAEILRRHFGSMKRWVEQVEVLAGDSHLWNRGFQFGDWLDPAAPPDQPARARTDAGLVATAYHARTAGIVAEAAAILGMGAEERRFEALASAVRRAFGHEYVTPGGRMASDAQTAFALGLQFGLLPTEEQRSAAGRRLQQLVRREGYHVGTGFVGTPLLCDALADAGYGDDAYHLLLQTECPSWLYPITMGATTIWERWDSMLPDGSVNPGEMTSFNHYAFGAVADFLHRRIAGLAPLDAGYRTIGVRPLVGGGLTFAEASREMAGGPARVRWEREGTGLRVEVEVPEGHSAVVELPDGSAARRVAAGSHGFECEVRAAKDDPARPAPPAR